MTDRPRFSRVTGDPEQAHLRHHGGGLVDVVLRLIDYWLAFKKAPERDVFGESRRWSGAPRGGHSEATSIAYRCAPMLRKRHNDG
jgi:hypothetical protein